MANVITLKASEHTIKSVTVFKSSKAEVVRSFKVDLTEGQNKVEIKGLSSCIDPLSVRVSGLGEARLYDVVCTVEQSQQYGFAGHDLDDASELIRSLNVKKGEIEKRKAIRECEARLLLQYAESLKGEHVAPAQMIDFMQTFTIQNQKNLQEVSKLDGDLDALNREIAKQESKVKTKKGLAQGRVDVVVVADGEVQVDLVLTYIVNRAQWEPTYELHAKTENGKPLSLVKLHYRARIIQSTGEDWTNTSLTLSTVSGADSRAIPSLKPVKLSPQPFGGPKKGLINMFSNANAVRPNVMQFQQQRQQQPQQPQAGNAFWNSQTTGTSGFAGAFGPTQAPVRGLFGSQPAAGFAGQPQAATGGSLFGTQATVGGGGFQAATGGGLFGTSQAASGGGDVSAGDLVVPLPDEEEEEEEQFEELSTGEPIPAIAEPTTIVNETPVAVTFSVHGESTIPSDGIAHQVSVAILPFESTISYITVPKIDARVYLQCRVKNSSDYRLLPGSVRVIFDDSFASSTRINEINTGDDFECTLGDDPSTKVTYSRTLKSIKSNGGNFAETTNTTTYTTKISVHNKHTFDIDDLVVRHVIPMCEDKRGQVILRKPDELAKAKEGQILSLPDGLKVTWSKSEGSDGKGGEKEGRYEWIWKVASGAKVNLEAEWDVKVPGEYMWAE
ncbi:hypothetical protein FA15DRAFT_698701 [Coprinopsis marcescibilis]|uniref:DUF4139 domain-containing protein n=1 Tax=Coprinopsis marcescibilis TaxID=230819 RepID=A0A5C3K9C3_COPMA|nr:hypothetical protein FA15DRAFT_698701 [Coprinopsis marcescibilis]